MRAEPSHCAGIERLSVLEFNAGCSEDGDRWMVGGGNKYIARLHRLRIRFAIRVESHNMRSLLATETVTDVG